MEKIKIYHSTELLSGGCNACVNVNVDMYRIEINEIVRPLENLDVLSIITIVALANGFRQQQEYDIDEDYDIFKKSGVEVSVHDDMTGWRFVKGNQSFTALKKYENPAELFQVINQLLITYFELEEKNFELNQGEK
ncbi:DUF4809 family protein [Vagococcus silagei]|uniref:DUF4809 family protein n=1 Tax=Vagococcus silagei TaxID=2508885 RepID=A0A4S3B895_9ENTE|nr:DUF4809 family protein [Vagococcus silagei]THB61085.1 DUF4809 family protein [Vagococcus silagei]